MAVFKMIYLASQSPRRKELLRQIGIDFLLLLPDSSENAEALEATIPGESPRQYVKRVTRLKLDAAVMRLKRNGWPLAPILCADTTVGLDATVLGKPESAAHAHEMLAALAGRDHIVTTAVAVFWDGQRVERQSSTRVTFGPLTESQIQAYIASGEPFGKAGAYGIQGFASAFIKKIVGSYSGVVGLPLYETAALLRSIGY